MSHGGNVEIPEPNLTPLLDLVLQLLMFFLIVANFVVEQNNQDIMLPAASTAVPIEKEQKNVLSLNVDLNGRLVISQTDIRESDAQISLYLRDKYNLYKQERGSDKAAKEVAVVMRGDNRASFEHIYRIMKAAKDAGFEIVQLRANKQMPGGP